MDDATVPLIDMLREAVADYPFEGDHVPARAVYDNLADESKRSLTIDILLVRGEVGGYVHKDTGEPVTREVVERMYERTDEDFHRMLVEHALMVVIERECDVTEADLFIPDGELGRDER